MMHVCELLGGFYFDDRVKGVIRNHLDCHQGSFRPYRTLYQSCRKESSQWSYCSSLLSFRKFSQSVIVLLATMLFRLRRIGKWRSCFKRKQLGKEWYYRAWGRMFQRPVYFTENVTSTRVTRRFCIYKPVLWCLSLCIPRIPFSCCVDL